MISPRDHDTIRHLRNRAEAAEARVALLQDQLADAANVANRAEDRVRELEAALRPFVVYVHDDLRAGRGTYALEPAAPVAGGWIGAEDLRAAAAALGRAET